MKRFLFAWKLLLAGILLFLILPCFAPPVYADNCTSAATGDWNANATWNTCNEAGTGYPDRDDAVTIGAHTVTIRNAAGINGEAASVTCNLGAAGTCAIAVETGRSLNVTTNIIVNRKNFNVALTLSGAGTATASAITLGTGAVDPTADRTTTLTTTISSLSISGNIAVSAYEGTANTSENLPTFNLNAGILDVNGTISINDDGAAGAVSVFTLAGATSGPTLILSGSGDPITKGTNSTYTPASTGQISTVNYDGAGQTVEPSVTYDSLTLSGSGTKTMTTVATINNDLSLQGSASATSGSNMTIGGTLSIGSSASFTFGGTNTFTVTGATTVDGTLTLSTSGATQTFTGLATINGTLNITNGTVTKTFSAGIDINTGGIFDNDNNNAAITTDTTFANDGTFNSGTGTYTFNAATTISGGNAITFNGTVAISGAIIVQNSNANTVTLNGDLTGSAAGSTWQQNNGSTVDFRGAVLATGAISAGTNSNTVYYTGTNATACKGGTYYNLEYQRSSACAIGANLTVNHNFNITNATGVFEIGAFTSTVTGATTVTGTLRISSITGTKTFGDLTIANGAHMEFTVAEAITMNGDLTINGTGVIDGAATSGTWTFQKPIGVTTGSIGGTMSSAETIGPITIITAYTISIPLNITGALTYTNASATNSATLTTTTDVTGNSGTSYFNNNGTLSVGGNLTGTNGHFTQGTNANLTLSAGSTMTNLDYSANGNTVTYNDNAIQTIRATTYHHLNIQPTATITETLSAGTYTINGNLVIGNGTNTTIVSAANDPNISVGGNFTVNANATFSGHNTAGHSLNIDGNLIINSGAPANGTFTAPTIAADPFTIGGNLTNNGTFNNSNGTITFDDSSKTSTLTYSANTTFRNFTVNTKNKHLIFDAFERTVITGALNLSTSDPDDCNQMIILTSEVAGNQFEIDPQGTETIDYVNVTDSNAITPILAANLTNSKGYNYTNWNFGTTICGSLTLSAPSNTTLSTVQLSFPRPNATGSLGTTTATDTRGTNVGWSLVATCTNFTDGGNTIAVTNLTIDPDNATLDAVTGSLTGVTAGVQHTFAGTSDPANVITASSGEGTGSYEIDPNLSLSIPAGAFTGNYSATMTLTLN